MIRFTILLLALVAAPLAAQQHAGSYTAADIENGARLYSLHCSACHGVEGNTVPEVDLRRGQLRRGSSDEDLARVITNGIPGTAMPPNKFTPAELHTLLAYLRSMREIRSGPVALGDAHQGRAIFEGKGGCLACHRVNGNGSRLSVDLSEIGALRTADVLEAALVDPAKTVSAQRRFVRAVTTSGRVINGRRLNEDTFTIQLMDDQERLVSFFKSDLREYTVVKTSTMPSYKDKLSASERADLIAYLVSLKGPDKKVVARP